MKRIGLATLAFVAAAGASWAVLRLVEHLVTSPGPYLWDLFLLEAIVYLIPAAIGFTAARQVWLRHRPVEVKVVPVRKWVVALVVTGYAVTWAFGVPAIHSTLSQAEEQSALAEVAAHPDLAPRPRPLVGYAFAVPLLPGVVLSYETFNGRKGQSGGWMIHLWYVAGVRPIFWSARQLS